MCTLISAMRNFLPPDCKLPTLTYKQALITSLASGIILGLAGCLVGILSSITSLIIVSGFILGVSLLIAGILLSQRFCSQDNVLKPEIPEQEIPELEIPEFEIPELELLEPSTPPPSFIPPKPPLLPKLALKNTIKEMLFGWNSIESEKLLPCFLSSDKILLSFNNPSARFRAWNIPGSNTLFITTSGQYASLKLQSNLPSAIANSVQSISCPKGGRGTNDLFSAVITDRCWEESKPSSGLLLPGECSSAPWEDNDVQSPTWNFETQTYNKPTRFIQISAPKASMYSNSPAYCYQLCFKAYLSCFKEAIRHGCHIIQIPLIASFPDFLPGSQHKEKVWIDSTKLALLHAIAIIAHQHRSDNIVIVLMSIPRPIYF